MTEEKKYDLGERTFGFAKRVRAFIKLVKKTISNFEDLKQLSRSSGSVGANFIEAEDNLGEKDFYLRIKICRKEAKESVYWLNLLDMDETPELISERDYLIDEGEQLKKIFGAIITKQKNKSLAKV